MSAARITKFSGTGMRQNRHVRPELPLPESEAPGLLCPYRDQCEGAPGHRSDLPARS